MSVASIRTDIYTIVAAVTNIGLVYDRLRYTDEWSKYMDLFKTTVSGLTQVRGWVVSYDGMSQEVAEMSPNAFRAQRFKVRGYMSFDDSAESEKTAANLAEAVCNALDDAATLHGGSYYDASQAEIEFFEPRMFGSVLCHYVEIGVTVTEFRV